MHLTGIAMRIWQYDLRDYEMPGDIEHVHGGSVGPNSLYTDGRLRISRTLSPPGLSLTGDIDASNVDTVSRWLDDAIARGGDVHVELGGLLFCDAGGMRALVSAATRLGHGRRLVLHGMPAELRRVMRVVGWDEAPGLVVDGDSDHDGRAGAGEAGRRPAS